MTLTTRSLLTRHLIATSIAALSLAFGASDTRAAGLEEPAPSAQVRLSDLNLNTNAGIETLYKRIKGAARLVCTASEVSGDGRRLYHWWQCYNAAVADAVAKVGNTRLTAMHEQRMDRKRPS